MIMVRREVAWWVLAGCVAALLFVGLYVLAAPVAWFVLGAGAVIAVVRLAVWEHHRQQDAELAALPRHLGWDGESPMAALSAGDRCLSSARPRCIAHGCRVPPLRGSMFCPADLWRQDLLCEPRPDLRSMIAAASYEAERAADALATEIATAAEADLRQLDDQHAASRAAIVRLAVLGPPRRHALPDLDGDVIEVRFSAAEVRELTAGAR